MELEIETPQALVLMDKSNCVILVKELSFLPNYQTVTSLTLNYCSIISLDGFPTMPFLEILNLKNNAIEKDLSALVRANVSNLCSLDLTDNLISDFMEIIELQYLMKLQHVVLTGCPVMETPFIRRMTFGYLLNLLTLNGSDDMTDEYTPLPGEIDSEMTIEIDKSVLEGYANRDMGSSKSKKEFKLYNDFSHCPIINTKFRHNLTDSNSQVEINLNKGDSTNEACSTNDNPSESSNNDITPDALNLKRNLDNADERSEHAPPDKKIKRDLLGGSTEENDESQSTEEIQVDEQFRINMLANMDSDETDDSYHESSSEVNSNSEGGEESR